MNYQMLRHKNDTEYRAFITGYTPNPMTQSQLQKQLKKKFHSIINIRLTSKSKYWNGFGYVNFKTEEDLHGFLQMKRIRLECFNMNLVLKPAEDGADLKNSIKEVKMRKVGVKKIPLNWDDYQLESFFSRFGEIENAYLFRMTKKNKKTREGMIIFNYQEDARNCAELGKIEVKPEIELIVRLKYGNIHNQDQGHIHQQRQSNNEVSRNRQQDARIDQNMNLSSNARRGNFRKDTTREKNKSFLYKAQKDYLRPTKMEYFFIHGKSFQRHLERYPENYRMNEESQQQRANLNIYTGK